MKGVVGMSTTPKYLPIRLLICKSPSQESLNMSNAVLNYTLLTVMILYLIFVVRGHYSKLFLLVIFGYDCNDPVPCRIVCMQTLTQSDVCRR